MTSWKIWACMAKLNVPEPAAASVQTVRGIRSCRRTDRLADSAAAHSQGCSAAKKISAICWHFFQKKVVQKNIFVLHKQHNSVIKLQGNMSYTARVLELSPDCCGECTQAKREEKSQGSGRGPARGCHAATDTAPTVSVGRSGPLHKRQLVCQRTRLSSYGDHPHVLVHSNSRNTIQVIHQLLRSSGQTGQTWRR